MRRTILIGERANSTYVAPFPAFETEVYRRLMLSMGALRRNRNLLRLDLVTTDTINLLPPSTQDVPWGRRWARVIAETWRSWLLGYDRVYLCGRRVTAAFGIRLQDATFLDMVGTRWSMEADGGLCFQASGSAVLLPHPSGLNRWWNDDARVEKLRRMIRADV